jgi:hypothetical protein
VESLATQQRIDRKQSRENKLAAHREASGFNGTKLILDYAKGWKVREDREDREGLARHSISAERAAIMVC